MLAAALVARRSLRRGSPSEHEQSGEGSTTAPGSADEPADEADGDGEPDSGKRGSTTTVHTNAGKDWVEVQIQLNLVALIIVGGEGEEAQTKMTAADADQLASMLQQAAHTVRTDPDQVIARSGLG